jgi:protease I
MKLKNIRVAILAADGFEQIELVEPRKALEQAAAATKIVSPAHPEVQGWNHFDAADKFPVDVHLERANADEFDALLLPGGVANADTLRGLPKAVEFVKKFAAQGKPIAAICHGPWLLIEAGIARGRKLTSWPTLKTDLKNAGANWVDQEVVVDEGLVTSRKPADLPAFNERMVELFAAGRRQGVEARSRHWRGA